MRGHDDWVLGITTTSQFDHELCPGAEVSKICCFSPWVIIIMLELNARMSSHTAAYYLPLYEKYAWKDGKVQLKWWVLLLCYSPFRKVEHNTSLPTLLVQPCQKTACCRGMEWEGSEAKGDLNSCRPLKASQPAMGFLGSMLAISLAQEKKENGGCRKGE